VNKSLKILFLPKWYPNRFDALDGIFVVDHAKAAARKNDVFLLFVHSDAALSGSKTITYNKSGGFAEMIVYFRSIKTGILFIDRLFTAIRYFSVQFRSYYQIKKIWGRPDITHVHVLLRSSILACWLKKIENIPYIITEHWTGYDPKSGKKINPFKKKLLKYIIKKSEAVTTVSGCLQENMKRICKEANYLHISNAIDETIFCIQPKKPAAIKKLIHVSTLSDHQKNFGKILQAIAEVSQQRKDFELHIIGKGIERKKQMERAQKLNILDRFVFFHGYLPKQEVAQMIATSDLMIMFSKFENQPCEYRNSAK
jgi:glycosyltransferase involved in cell wall biosynthesis